MAKALGRIFIVTYLGNISVYILDAEDVPVLGGITLIEQLGMTIDFARNRAWFEYRPELGPIELDVVPSGRHRLLELTNPLLRRS